ncbi:hypothetical protein I33_3700 [Bacillus subtilis subsp. subtilis str. RO-NN-1]|nr:hypothetical protein I33_3700 [Bacillus subtilis subsp. subtilis str. RO-NN-1]AKE25384.1 hypothetical protein BsLM_3587 [Bacillus sp. LM 4-2]CCU60652.1 hypothetical protein BSUBE1_4021 [Bacillus subtilis E1]
MFLGIFLFKNLKAPLIIVTDPAFFFTSQQVSKKLPKYRQLYIL